MSEASEEISSPVQTIARFEIVLWWSDVDVDSPDWWWVYLLRPDDDDEARYIGMAKNIRRRLIEHRRGWMDDGGQATLIAATSEAEARRLELALISLLNPPNNTQKPTLSWAERSYFGESRRLWYRNELRLCPGCSCLCKVEDGRLVPRSEPDESCVEHFGPARHEWANQIVGGLMLFAGIDPFSARRQRDAEFTRRLYGSLFDEDALIARMAGAVGGDGS